MILDKFNPFYDQIYFLYSILNFIGVILNLSENTIN